jgi:hypothetical protein
MLNCERNAHASFEITENYAIVSGTLTQALLNSVKIFEKGKYAIVSGTLTQAAKSQKITL